MSRTKPSTRSSPATIQAHNYQYRLTPRPSRKTTKHASRPSKSKPACGKEPDTMAMDFPGQPTVGQVYTVGGLSYVWNGYAWAGGGSQPLPATTIVSDTPPANP